jgi:NAD+ kinase
MRSALLVTHTGRPDMVDRAKQAAALLADAGFEVRMLRDEAEDLGLTDVCTVPPDEATAAQGVEVVLVLGGDGTFLRAAEYARPCRAPLVGVNLGRVGFLTETEPEALPDTLRHLVERTYEVEERLTLDVDVRDPDGELLGSDWALNEVSVEKTRRERMLEVALGIDGRPLTAFGCDGVVCASPTGSTAYAFSSGGPVVWPEVQALLVVPTSAHALFARPLVIAPDSTITITLDPGTHAGILGCDGRRTATVPPGGQVVVRRGAEPVRIARIARRPFTERLVAKFGLPVDGFRANRS